MHFTFRSGDDAGCTYVTTDSFAKVDVLDAFFFIQRGQDNINMYFDDWDSSSEGKLCTVRPGAASSSALSVAIEPSAKIQNCFSFYINFKTMEVDHQKFFYTQRALITIEFLGFFIR